MGFDELTPRQPGYRQAFRPVSVTRPMVMVSWPRRASCQAGHASLFMGLPGYNPPISSPQVNLDAGLACSLLKS